LRGQSGVKPNYIQSSSSSTQSKKQGEESIWIKILREEMNNPECRRANLDILIGLGMFTGAITFLRFAGDILVPNF
ncbi:hypothetical protein BY996DRAFT_4584349, partial [Phakopsora pachyrhizi]